MINIAYFFPFWVLTMALFFRKNMDFTKKSYLIASFLPIFLVLVNKSVVYDSDMFRYLVVFQELSSGVSFDHVTFHFEFGFLLLSKIISFFSNENSFFIFTATLLYISLLVRLIYKLSYNIYYTTLIYICMGFVFYPSNILRASIAVIILANTLFIALPNIPLSVLFILISSSFHSSMIIFSTYLLVLDRFRKTIIIILVIILSYIYSFYSYYSDSKFFAPNSIGATFPISILYIIMSLYFMINLKKIKTDLLSSKIYALFTLCAGISLLLSFKFFIFTRLYISFSVFIPLFLDTFSQSLKKEIRFTFIITSSILYLVYYTFMVYYKNFSL